MISLQPFNPLEIKANSTSAWKRVKTYINASTGGYCSRCGNDIEKIHVHHKNGNGLDNRLENLIGLCPSCHKAEHRGEKRIRRYPCGDITPCTFNSEPIKCTADCNRRGKNDSWHKPEEE